MGVNWRKGAFSRTAETDRLSNKKNHVTTFVAELYSDNFYTWKRIEITELKVEATELRDKFRIYKLLIFQYYFSKVVVRLLYGFRNGFQSKLFNYFLNFLGKRNNSDRIHSKKFHNMYPDSWFRNPQDCVFFDIHGAALLAVYQR